MPTIAPNSRTHAESVELFCAASRPPRFRGSAFPCLPSRRSQQLRHPQQVVGGTVHHHQGGLRSDDAFEACLGHAPDAFHPAVDPFSDSPTSLTLFVAFHVRRPSVDGGVLTASPRDPSWKRGFGCVCAGPENSSQVSSVKESLLTLEVQRLPSPAASASDGTRARRAGVRSSSSAPVGDGTLSSS